MSTYLASRILIGALDYVAVVERYPQFKAEIDVYLLAKGRPDLIVD